MKVLMFGNAKIKYMPYVNFYLENLDNGENEIHIIYWNRDLKEESMAFSENVTMHEFSYFQNDQCSKIKKIKSYYKLRRFALKLMNREEFDFVVILDSLPGVLIIDKLNKYYKNKYIFDYRDSSYEWFQPYKKSIAKLATDSYVTFVSSDGFRKFFPEACQNKIYTSHNLLLDSLNHRDDKKNKGIVSNKIRVSFWGFIREKEINMKIIKAIALDDMLELHYYGREENIAQELKQYVSEHSIKNVFFHGEYKPEDRYNFILETDLIHNIYESDNMMCAMPNKYYDGIVFRIPQICMSKSYMGQRVDKAQVGINYDPMNDDLCQIIKQYFKQLDRNNFEKNCDIETEKILKEYNNGSIVVRNSVNM